MSLRRLVLGLGIGCAVACARPTLDDFDPSDGATVDVAPKGDGGADSAEASSIKPKADSGAGGASSDDDRGDDAVDPLGDAGLGSPPLAASCADTDTDTVCNDVDNCPKIANPDQEDADDDGRGDACPRVVVNCDGVPVPGAVEIGSATVDSVRINDQTETLARVLPGSEVSMRLSVKFNSCGSAFTPQPFYVGVESSSPSCQLSFCNPMFESPTLPFTFTAPTEPGLHYVLAGIGQSYSCSGSPSADTRIAALCVTPDP